MLNCNKYLKYNYKDMIAMCCSTHKLFVGVVKWDKGI